MGVEAGDPWMAGRMGVSSRTLRSQAQPFSPGGLWAGPQSLLSPEFSRHETSNDTHPASTSHDTELMGALQPAHPGSALAATTHNCVALSMSLPICTFTTHLESGDPLT